MRYFLLACLLCVSASAQVAGDIISSGSGFHAFDTGTNQAGSVNFHSSSWVTRTYNNPTASGQNEAVNCTGLRNQGTGSVGWGTVFTVFQLLDAGGAVLDNFLGSGTWEGHGGTFTRNINVEAALHGRPSGMYQVILGADPTGGDYAGFWVEVIAGPDCNAQTGNIAIVGDPHSNSWNIDTVADPYQGQVIQDFTITITGPNGYLQEHSNIQGTTFNDLALVNLTGLTEDGLHTITVTYTCPDGAGTNTFATLSGVNGPTQAPTTQSEWTRADIDDLRANASGLRADLAANSVVVPSSENPNTAVNGGFATSTGNLNGGITFNETPAGVPTTVTFPMPGGQDFNVDVPLDPRTWDTSDPIYSQVNTYRVVIRGLLAIVVSMAGVAAVVRTIRQY